MILSIVLGDNGCLDIESLVVSHITPQRVVVRVFVFLLLYLKVCLFGFLVAGSKSDKLVWSY